MEALSLSIPPIPGQSVLRRAGCENLTTLGSVLRTKGYETAFLYGGDGFFDNMNYFFESNGYDIVDLPRQARPGKQPTFANAWAPAMRTPSRGRSRRPTARTPPASRSITS
jgi:phosphoglycerol transferase MdoB-like AlkP superfamily enzyme